MLVLLDTSHDLKTCELELGCRVEQLFTPLTRRRPQDPMAHFAIDNGAFARFNPRRFLALLRRHEARKDLCRFVASPDVPYSARRTLEVFDYWYPTLCSWPLALVAQDGQEDLPIGWDLIQAVFVGGSTRWKDSQSAISIVKAAKAMGKWAHVGRVNEPNRFERFQEAGADSIDGTGLAQYTHMRKAIYESQTQPKPITLFSGVEDESFAHVTDNGYLCEDSNDAERR